MATKKFEEECLERLTEMVKRLSEYAGAVDQRVQTKNGASQDEIDRTIRYIGAVEAKVAAVTEGLKLAMLGEARRVRAAVLNVPKSYSAVIILPQPPSSPGSSQP